MRSLLLLLAACSGSTSSEPDAPVSAPEPAPVEAEPVPSPAQLPADLTLRPAAELRTSPAAVPLVAEAQPMRELLLGVVQEHGMVADNPWAIGHGLLALGPDAALPDGSSAVDWLFSEYAEELPLGDTVAVRFPVSRGAIRVEPHADLVLKVLTEVGVSPDRAVTVQGQPHTVADLYTGSLARAWVADGQTGFADFNDTPWALQGLATWAPEDLSWTATGGHAMTLDGYTHEVVGKLGEETAFMREAMANGTTVEKRRQGIFAYTCGGAHLFQGAAYAVARGYGEPEDRDAILRELSVWFWRAQLELDLVDELIRSQPQYAPVLLEQRLKFTGHLLESVHKVWALGLAEPTEAQLALVAILRHQLLVTVEAIDKLGLWAKLDEVRAADEQVYLDYVGDAAHALRALDLSTGEGSVRL